MQTIYLAARDQSKAEIVVADFKAPFSKVLQLTPSTIAGSMGKDGEMPERSVRSQNRRLGTVQRRTDSRRRTVVVAYRSLQLFMIHNVLFVAKRNRCV